MVINSGSPCLHGFVLFSFLIPILLILFIIHSFHFYFGLLHIWFFLWLPFICRVVGYNKFLYRFQQWGRYKFKISRGKTSLRFSIVIYNWSCFVIVSDISMFFFILEEFSKQHFVLVWGPKWVHQILEGMHHLVFYWTMPYKVFYHRLMSYMNGSICMQHDQRHAPKGTRAYWWPCALLMLIRQVFSLYVQRRHSVKGNKMWLIVHPFPFPDTTLLGLY